MLLAVVLYFSYYLNVSVVLRTSGARVPVFSTKCADYSPVARGLPMTVGTAWEILVSVYLYLYSNTLMVTGWGCG